MAEERVSEISGKEDAAGSEKKSGFSQKFKEWANFDLKMTLLFCLIGLVMGVIAFFLNSSLKSVLVSILMFIGSTLLARRAWKTKESKGWWFSKFVVFFFTWIIVWTILYNLYVVWA